MPSERLVLRYADGSNEWRTPANVPEVGSVIRRLDQEWVVAAIEYEGDELAVAILRKISGTVSEPPSVA